MPESLRKSRYISLLWQALVGVLLLLAVFYFVDFDKMFSLAAGLSPEYLLIFVALVYFDRAVVVHKWNLLLHVSRVRLPFIYLFQLYSTAQLTALVLPSTVGGDMFRIYHLRKLGIGIDVSAASIMVERALGFVCMLCIAVLALGVSLYLADEQASVFAGIAGVIGAAMLFFVALYWVVRDERVNVALRELVKRVGHKFGISRVYKLYQQCRGYRKYPAVLAKVTTWTLLRQILPIFMNMVLVFAYDIEVSVLELVAIIPLLVLGGRIPVSFSSIGVQEGLYVILFGVVGVGASEAVLLSLTFRALMLLSVLPIAIVYYFGSS